MYAFLQNTCNIYIANNIDILIEIYNKNNQRKFYFENKRYLE